jgi:seryl-tRNA synthetase
MKIDSKSWLIIILIIISVFFMIQWLKTRVGKFDIENKQLQSQIDSIQIQRDSLKNARALYDKKFDSLQNIIDKDHNDVIKLEKELNKSKVDLKTAKDDLDKEKNKVDEINAQIKDLKDHPIKREGGDLINSLRKKLN